MSTKKLARKWLLNLAIDQFEQDLAHDDDLAANELTRAKARIIVDMHHKLEMDGFIGPDDYLPDSVLQIYLEGRRR